MVTPRTRILATLGPASSNERTLAAMVRAGANAFRLNFSHGTHDEHRERVRLVRRVAKRLKTPISILQDLQGPKIRTGRLADGRPILLRPGERVDISVRARASTEGVIATNYRKIIDDVKVGDRILIDDGLLELEVRERHPSEGRVGCEVVCGGLLRSKKGINLPGVDVSTPALTRKDRRDLTLGAELGVDYVALSFVRQAADVERLRRIMKRMDFDAAIVAKLEKPEALDELEEILEISEGIMVARGDLGVEVPLERLPIVQKETIAAARARGRMVITATQMLESMIENPRPTRAETTDVANAILDGTDAVMLSGETAVGRYPVEVVRTMRSIATQTEKSDLYRRVSQGLVLDPGRDIADATVHAGCAAAAALDARVLVAFSSSGRTCFKLSFARPRTRIIGATFSERTWRRLALCWGVEPILLKEARNIDELYFLGEKYMLERGGVSSGELSVLITGSNIGAGGTNSIKIHRVGTVDLTDDPRVIARFNRLYARRRSG